MRKLLFLLLVMSAIVAKAQTIVKLEKDPSGTYKIQCKVNGAPMKMYFDTGASKVSISKSTAMYLYDNDLIGEDDFIGTTKAIIADGSFADATLIRLKDVEIAGLHLKNIDAYVSSSLNAPLLLGQSVISKLGKITIDDDKLIIHSHGIHSLSQEEREALDNKIRELRKTKKTNMEASYQIIEIVKKIEKSDEPNEFELFCKTMEESNNELYDEVIIDSKKWLDIYGAVTDSIDWKMPIVFASGRANLESDNGDKKYGYQQIERCYLYYYDNIFASFFWLHYPRLVYLYANHIRNNYYSAFDASKISTSKFLKLEKTNLNVINQNKYEGVLSVCFELMASCFYAYVEKDKMSMWSENDNRLLDIIAVMAAKAGSEFYINYCRDEKINYKKKLSEEDLGLLGIK